MRGPYDRVPSGIWCRPARAVARLPKILKGTNSACPNAWPTVERGEKPRPQGERVAVGAVEGLNNQQFSITVATAGPICESTGDAYEIAETNWALEGHLSLGLECFPAR